MTPAKAYISCNLKANRATEHFNTLREEILGFFQPDPKKPIFQFETDRSNITRIRIIRPLPPKWGVIVGDCIYNLRCALDHLVSITAEKNGARPGDTEFPIFIDPVRYAEVDRKGKPTRGSGLTKVIGLPAPAQALIERLQPYNRTDGPPDLHPLWLLHELSNHDKHRKVDLVHAAIKSGHAAVHGLGGGPIERLAIPVGAIKDGTVITGLQPLLGSVLPRKVKVNFEFTPDVAFSPEGPGRGLPLTTTLITMNKAVNDIIIAFEPFVS